MDISYQEKLSTLKMLAQLINIDNKARDEELTFYVRVAKKMGVTSEDYTKVFHNEYHFVLPEMEYKRIVLFHNLLLLAYSDAEIDEKEIHFCHEMGLKFGLNTFAIQDILLKLKEQPQIGIDPFRVNRVFKRYYN